MKKNKEIFFFLLQYKKTILICLFFLVLEIIMDLMSPYILANIINIGIRDNKINYIIINVLIMMLLSLIGIIGGIVSTYLSSKISSNVGYKIRNRIIEKISSLQFNELDNLNVSHTMTLITNDVSNIENIILLSLKTLIKIPFIIIGSIIMCYIISPKMSLILIVVIPIIILLSLIMMKLAYPYFNLTEQALDELNFKVRENIGGIKVIKSNNREKEEIKKFDKVNNSLKNVNKKALKILGGMMPLIMLIMNITTVLILWFGSLEVTNSSVIGNIMAFIEYVTLLLSSILSLSMFFLLAIQSSIGLKRINNLLNKPLVNKNRLIEKKIEGKIEFKNVNFSYSPGSGDYTLKNINLLINKGEKVAIVGPTGSGKSTILNLLTNLYEIEEGKILLDDLNVDYYNEKDIRKNIGYIIQNSLLFKDNILNNIINKKNKSEIKKYSKITCSDKIINNKKYDFLIEQKGKNLSGGEKQRLILLRMLLRKPNVLILDDSLSAIDLKNETTIINNLLKEYEDKTVIIVTNRLQTITNFPKIILVEDGMIKQIGTHKELMKNNTYKELYNSSKGVL